MVLLGILEYVDSPQLDLERVVGAPRFHHQYLPDRVLYRAAALRHGRGMGGGTARPWDTRWSRAAAAGATCRPCSWTSAAATASAYNDPRGKAGMLF